MRTHHSRGGGLASRIRLPLPDNCARSLLALFAAAIATTSLAHAAQVNITLVNGISGEPLPRQVLTVHQRLDDGSRKWVSRNTTDANGRVVWDLKGLDAGRTYQMRAEPYGGNVWSKHITRGGNHRFEVGKVQVRVTDGSNGRPLTNTEVSMHRVGDGGKLSWTQKAVTDAEGVLRLDPPALGSGRSHVLRAKSTIDGSIKQSTVISSAGTYKFVVGGQGLTVSLVDGASGKPLANKSVTVYKRLKDGARRRLGKRSTNASGNVVWDLEGLGAGAKFQLLTKAYGDYVWSTPISEPGIHRLEVGRVQARILSGVDRKPLANFEVKLQQLLDGGKVKLVKRARTDANGRVRLDPAGLSNGNKFALFATSPVDGSTQRSETISKNGFYDFVVGGAGLNVTLVDGVSGKALPGRPIAVYRVLRDGTRKWARRRSSDANGKTTFDLDALPDGARYELLATLHGDNARAYSSSATGDIELAVGSVQVRVLDARTGKPMSGKKVQAFRKSLSGNIAFETARTSDAAGLTFFNLKRLDGQHPYVFRVVSPFGENRRYFSKVIKDKGAIDLALNPEEDDRLDTKPPTLSVTSPGEGALVADAGVRVSGKADDNVGVTGITVTVVDPVAGTNVIPAVLDPHSGHWTAKVSGAALTLGRKVDLVVRAEDADLNATTVSRRVEVVRDETGPSISVSSHNVSDVIADTGAIIHGTAVDDIGTVRLTVRVRNSKLGLVQPERTLDVARSGNWSLVLRGAHQVADSVTTVKLTGLDDAGNRTSREFRFDVAARDYRLRQLINRTSFGASPELIDWVESVGFDAYLDAQLDPMSIDDAELEMRLDDMELRYSRQLQGYQVLRAATSQRQLQEVMTLFWDNHFSTNFQKHQNVSFELKDNIAFRQNALGNFRDLLGISTKSPAMLIYLDNVKSSQKAPNENFARELMELHTLGLASGESMSAPERFSGAYTQDDVAEVARTFTGWKLDNGRFEFKLFYHDRGSKQVLGTTIPAGSGIEGGEAVLDMLAVDPYTADRICTKLGQLFVADAPSDELIIDCTDTFLNNVDAPDQIAQVVSMLLRSDEFASKSLYRAKVKTPLEFVAGTVRALGIAPNARVMAGATARMHMNLFMNTSPDGFAEEASHWLNSDQLLNRVLFVRSLVLRGMGNPNDLDATAFALDNGVETAEGIVGRLFQLAFDDPVSDLEWDTAMGILTREGTSEFVIDGKDTQQRLRELIAMTLSYPGFNYQ